MTIFAWLLRAAWVCWMLYAWAPPADAAVPLLGGVTQSDIGTTVAPLGADGTASALSIIASGGTTRRTLAERAAERINLLDYGAAGTRVDQTGAVDVSGALAAAINAANAAMAGGRPACIYVPAGSYRVLGTSAGGTAIPAFATGRPGCIVGDGPRRSTVVLDTSFAGDLFVWSEAWNSGGFAGGAHVADVAVMGALAATAQQNAFVFYDRNDDVSLVDVDVTNVPGRALAFGLVKNTPANAYVRESRLQRLRLFNDGAPGVPVVEINSDDGLDHTDDASNEVDFDATDIYGARGPSLVVRSVHGVVRDLKFADLRIEGLDAGTTAADLVTIGDPVLGGTVNSLDFARCELISAYPGFASLRLTAADASLMPYNIHWQGLISSGNTAAGVGSQGIRIDAGRNLQFDVLGVYTIGPNIVVGMAAGSTSTPQPAPMVAGPIVIDGGGAAAAFTYAVNPADLVMLATPTLRMGQPGAAGNTTTIAGTLSADAVQTPSLIVTGGGAAAALAALGGVPAATVGQAGGPIAADGSNLLPVAALPPIATPQLPRGGIVPAVHLAKSRAAGLAAKYCILGDSTATVAAADNVTPSDLLWGKLKQRIQEDERAAGTAIADANFANFAIGGTTLSNVIAGQVGGTGALSAYPVWWTDHTHTWLSYLQAAGCTAVILDIGVNDPGYEGAGLFQLYFQQLAAWPAGTPDLVLITNAVANAAAGAPYSQPAYQAGYLANAGLQRTLAASGNKLGVAGVPAIGLIDIGRYFNQAVLGRDPVQQPLSYIVAPSTPLLGITAFPYQLGTSAGGDLYASITFPGLGAAMQAAGTVVTVSLGDGQGGTGGFAATQVNFQSTSGTACYANYFFNGPSAVINNSSSWSPGDVTFTVSAQGDHMVFGCNGAVVADIVAPRLVGPFVPTVGISNPPSGLTMTIGAFATGAPKRTTTSVLAAACYGSLGGLQSGNGINHDSSACLNAVYLPVLEATSF